jgi:hypothetical protein
MFHPITFSIAEEKIITIIPSNKTKILSSLIPDQLHTYIYNTEQDYYNEYRQSYFAITTKKAGWDCMRHYEILANGCIPYFIDIESCPPNTMALLPKDLFIQGNQLYKKFSDKSIDQLSEIDISEYNSLLQQLLDYTRTFLTTKKLALYVLEKSGFPTATNILYLSGDTDPDYLRCVTLHGFKSIYGENCHDYPKISHIYKSTDINYHSLYGRGFTYTNLLNPSLHNYLLTSTIEQDILNKKYDIVIYGSYHRGMPYYDLVCHVYKPNEIILMCGEDIHHCNYMDYVNRGHTVFIREL